MGRGIYRLWSFTKFLSNYFGSYGWWRGIGPDEGLQASLVARDWCSPQMLLQHRISSGFDGFIRFLFVSLFSSRFPDYCYTNNALGGKGDCLQDLGEGDFDKYGRDVIVICS
ncbi:uncharacterized protein LOC131234475 [Magnolia sinica]|uniref:uncharacterized protein LOC131234475 n=1 Tax=Magnolia sinica TaxID=86752 RepID=UPI0026585CC3|nr:uncharacterized protein LOC131234475 [Magnolia sinica]